MDSIEQHHHVGWSIEIFVNKEAPQGNDLVDSAEYDYQALYNSQSIYPLVLVDIFAD